MILRTLVLAAGVLANALSVAATTEVLDLGGPVLERTVNAGEPFNLIVISKLPKNEYRLKTTVREIEIPPFTVPSQMKPRSGSTLCETLAVRFLQTLEAIEQEEKVASEISGFRTSGQQCSDAERADLEAAISRTTQQINQSYTLNPGQELVVTVERDGRRWIFVLSTGARGEWRTFYGFNFMPNGDEEYFSAQDPADPASFTVTRKADREELDFAPSIIFSWKPASQVGRTWGHGLAMGLGFDLSNPIVFGGYGATYNENVALTAGLVFHKQRRLDGRFEDGQTIGENLDSDNLTIETYTINYYVGIGFRFGGNGAGNPPSN